MAPKSPWKKRIPTKPPENHDDNTADEARNGVIDYAEAQTDEIEVLKAIFMEDFEEVAVKNAWSKTSDHAFKLRLRSFSDESAFVILTVKLTATYPRTAPLLDLTGLETYHERTRERINDIVKNRPKRLLGEVMIHAVASEIQEALEDAVQARQSGALPSLDEERASAEEVANERAKRAAEEEAQRAQEAQQEEERMLSQMVAEEITRRENRKSNRFASESLAASTSTDAELIAFEQPAYLQLRNEDTAFSTLNVISTLRYSSEDQLLLAKPQLAASASSIPLVTVRRVTIRKPREYIMDLETALASVAKVRHPGLLGVYAFRFDRIELTGSQLVLCSEYAERGDLRDLLQLGELHRSKARQFTIEALEALDFLHGNGIVHGHINARTIFVSQSPVSAKLGGLGCGPLMEQQQHDVPEGWAFSGSTIAPGLAGRKSDVWHLAIVITQMFLGFEIVFQHSSPHDLLTGLDLSPSFQEMLRRVFVTDAKKIPSAFDLLPAEFLRTVDPVFAPDQTHDNGTVSTARSTSSIHNPSRGSQGRPSHTPGTSSRYANDFIELGRLGKGGFGEVVKARNKLDGGVYAVKRIKQAQKLLDQVISEVMLLNRLNHPYVVRYFSTWLESAGTGSIAPSHSRTGTSGATGTEDTLDESDVSDNFGFQSTGGLDFISSHGYPQVEFGDDSKDDEEDEDVFDESANEDSTDAAASISLALHGRDAPHRRKSDVVQRTASVLYIQMEYCERQTLRDLIRKTISEDHAWRFVRQITEGLAHIHGHGIIHRDLKPDNVFIDVAGNPKIGDFGLARTGQYNLVDRQPNMSSRSGGADLTRSIGTALYVAPEIRSNSGDSYNDKVDMYSLGIMFYEMCESFMTAMERIRALQDIRDHPQNLPNAYLAQGAKASQGRLISSLIAHKPSDRPSSTELLRSDILPVKVEDETLRQALGYLYDPRSPYYQQMMSVLFAHESASANRVRNMAWDAKIVPVADEAKRQRMRCIAKASIEAVFRRHGAEEGRRHGMFPRSDLYLNSNIVQVLDASGNLLQLPYDLTLPYAKHLARQQATTRCSFAFGNAYRDAFSGGPPRASEEVDFDIVSRAHSSTTAVDDAEILKVTDEVVASLPLFAKSAQISLVLNHASILNAVLEHCRVPVAQHAAVKEIISRLGYHQWQWVKVRPELRKFGLPDTTLDDLQQFDFRDGLEKASGRLKGLFEQSAPQLRAKLESGMRTLSSIIKHAAVLGVQQPIYIAPLGSVNARLYGEGILFQCVLERKSTRIVIAAGGRYDALIRSQRQTESRAPAQGAVGLSIGLDQIVTNMIKNSETSAKRSTAKSRRVVEEHVPKRCDVLVTALGSEAMQGASLRLLSSLWSSGISAELASSTYAFKEKEYAFIVALRHEASTTVRVSSTEGNASNEEVDVPITGLVTHLQHELRDSEHTFHSTTTAARKPNLLRHTSQPDATDRKSNVQVLLARYGSKKTNKYQIVSDAQEQWHRKLDGAKSAPILAVETRDEVLDIVQGTKLSDAESWRRAAQAVPLADRQYVQQIQEVLEGWRKRYLAGEEGREACVFNFRTQGCVYYDLAL